MDAIANNSSGVQELIEQIRDQGVQAAKNEADRLLREAQKQAAEIVAQAKAEADAERVKARADIEAHRAASLDALQLAARDTVLELKARVITRVEEFVRRLVVSATQDKELVRSLVLVLAGHAADEFIKDKDIEVRISKSLLDDQSALEEESKRAILGLSSDMLREGLQLVADDEIAGGARVRLVDDKLEIDLSDRVVSRMIAQRMIPRFVAILEGAE